MKSKKTILLIEDDQDLRELTREILEENQFIVEEAQNSETAETMLTSIEFDLVLSDLNIPGSNGIKILEWARNKGIKVPFIFLSGSVDIKQILENQNNEFQDYLSKPFTAEDLIEKIRNFLES